MASRSVGLVVHPRGKPIKALPGKVTVALSDSGADLYKSLAGSTRFPTSRLRVTKGNDGSVVPNSKNVTIESTGLRDRSTVVVKDLGPQIGWRTVFIIEYLGPLLIHPAFYLLRPYIYPTPSLTPSSLPPPTLLQTLSLAMITLHFVKRELETVFVHRFSAATMPFSYVFRNSAHYWILAGLNIAYWTYAPSSPTATAEMSPTVVVLSVLLYLVCELGNLQTHLILRGLRSQGGTERGIPKGLGFNAVTCPNYTFEVFAWFSIWMVNQSWSTAFFAVTATAIMTQWAKKKERRYRREFGDKYEKKKCAILPGIV